MDQQSSKPTRPIPVFLADDHEVIRKHVITVLQGYSSFVVVGQAGTGEEAVKGVASIKPEIVLMDIAMPELDGIEATRQIAALAPGARVIMLSMHSAKAYVQGAFEAGAWGYVLKESACTELAKAILAVHDGHRFIDKALGDTADLITES